jgi:hypothetical protein
VATRLEDYERQLKALAGELAGIGFMSQGSVVCRYTRCGKPGCRCQDDPPRPHGPYWQWSRAVGGKTLTRRITAEQAAIYKEWIANRRRALRIITEIERISREAGEIVLEEESSEPAPRQVP